MSTATISTDRTNIRTMNSGKKCLCKHVDECPYETSEEFNLLPFQLKLKIIFGIVTWLINVFSIIWYAFPALFAYDLTDNVATSNCCFQFYFFYLTHLTLCAQSLYYISSLYLYRVQKGNPCSNYCSYIHYTMRASSIIGITIGIGIVMFYWLFLNKTYNLWFKNLLRISQHGISLLLLLIDDIVNNVWFRYKDAFIIFIFTTLYIILLIIHWLSGMGRAKDVDTPGYIYEMLNFHENTAMVFMLCVGLQIITTLFYLLIAFIKKKFIKYKLSKWAQDQQREQEERMEMEIRQPVTSILSIDSPQSNM